MASKSTSPANARSFFVVIEGIDGSGKSSVARRIAQKLGESYRQNVKLTFEPHDPSCAGVYIRQVLTKRLTGVPLHTLALAFAVNRSDHCHRDISPFLDGVNGLPRILVCDRYYLSSLVYQSDDVVTFDDVMHMNREARKPDLTLFLNASDRTCYKRMKTRNEGKELFEVHLSRTKAKYAAAMAYLREVHGERIVEIEAEGTLEEVTDQALDVLHRHGPPWLSVGIPTLPIDLSVEPYTPTDTTLDSVAETIYRRFPKGPIDCPEQLDIALEQLRLAAVQTLRETGYNACANLFLDCLRQSGYQVGEKLPWTDLDAFEVSFGLPLGIQQSGAVLLLGESQRYDMINPRLLVGEKLDRMSDFLFVLDMNPAHLAGRYFEREPIRYADSSALSPVVCIVNQATLVTPLLERLVARFEDDRGKTLWRQPGLSAAFAECKRKMLGQPGKSFGLSAPPDGSDCD